MATATNTAQTAQARKERGFRVIYRHGGPARFQWRKVLTGYATRKEAQECVEEIERMGYHAEIRTPESLVHGLPETWEAGESCREFKTENGWTIRK